MKHNGNSKIAVVGWGRGMGHKGHMYLADAVITQANEMRADPYFFVSKTVGKDDPVFPEEKVRIYQKVFPQYAPIFTPQGNLNQALQELAQLGYQGVVVVVGADQKKAFQYLEGNNKEGVPVYQSLGLKKLRVISRQETNSKFANEEGPRATPMREILLNPDASEEDKFKVWRRDMPDELGDREVLDIMNKAESRLVHTNAPKVLSKMSKKAAKLKEAIIRFKENKQLEEARILNPNNKVLVYFRPDTGKTGTPVTNRPISLDMAERLIATYVERHKGEGYRPVFPNNFEIRPAGHSEYTRTEDVEEDLNEFAIDKPDDSDGRSKLIGSIVRLLQAGNRVDFFVPGIRGHISGVGNQGDTLIMKRWKKPYSKVNYSLPLDSSDDERFVLKMINPDYYQVVEKQDLNEFAPDDGGDSRVPMHFVVEKELYNPRSKWKKSYNPGGGGVLLFTTKEEAIQAAEKFNRLDKNREFKYGGTQMADTDLDEGIFGGLGGPASGPMLARGGPGYAGLSGAKKLRHDAYVELQMIDSLKHTNHNGRYDEEIKKKLLQAKEYLAKAKEIEQGLAEASFDKEAFRQQMKDLEAREELRKTDPVSAKALDLRRQLPQQSKKKPEDDSIGTNDPRHPGYAYTQAGQHKLDEFAPSDSDDGLPQAEYQVYQCQPDDQFEWIGGPLMQTDDMGKAHNFAYFLWKKHPNKCFMIWQERSQGSRGGYGPKGSVLAPSEEDLNEFAPDDSGDSGQEDMFFKYAKMWYNGNDAVKQRVEEILAQAGWEIGPLESEEGGAFIVQSGDENGDTYMGWSAQELQGIDESSTDYLDEK